MNIGRLVVIVAASFFSVEGLALGNDRVQPFPQPAAVTITEKSGVKFKPQLDIEYGCHPFPAVNAAGDTNAGLETSGAFDCRNASLGSQVYGRAEWYNDVWAIMYAWYFPKGYFDGTPWWRHDWSNAIVWIDNPAHENPKVLGLSLSTSENKYGNTYEPAEGIENGTTPTLSRNVEAMETAKLDISVNIGDIQDLIMWDQLTDEARAALNDQDNFGRTDVPISDEHFPELLEKAWPF